MSNKTTICDLKSRKTLKKYRNMELFKNYIVAVRTIKAFIKKMLNSDNAIENAYPDEYEGKRVYKINVNAFLSIEQCKVIADEFLPRVTNLTIKIDMKRYKAADGNYYYKPYSFLILELSENHEKSR